MLIMSLTKHIDQPVVTNIQCHVWQIKTITRPSLYCYSFHVTQYIAFSKTVLWPLLKCLFRKMANARDKSAGHLLRLRCHAHTCQIRSRLSVRCFTDIPLKTNGARFKSCLAFKHRRMQCFRDILIKLGHYHLLVNHQHYTPYVAVHPERSVRVPRPAIISFPPDSGCSPNEPSQYKVKTDLVFLSMIPLEN